MSEQQDQTTATGQAVVEEDAISGATVLVGDMIEWSDLAGLPAPQAASEVVRSLVDSTAPQRILLAGPRAALLLPVIPLDSWIDVIVRSLPDVRDISVLGGLHSRVSHFCGSFTSFEPARSYDLVIALGGPQRLISPDCAGLTTEQTIGRLSELLSPSGVLVTDLANELGLTDLVSAVPDPQREQNESWWVGADGFSTRAPYARERDALLGAAGLHRRATYAALPQLDEYNLLIQDDLAADPDSADEILSVAAQATTQQLADLPMLRDVHDTLERVTGAGLLDQLAPAWLIVADKVEDADPQRYAGLPRIVQVEAGLNQWSQELLVDASGSVTRRWADGASDEERSEGGLRRSLITTTAQGRTLEQELLDACASRTHSAIRRLVRQYAAWLADEDVWADGAAAQRFFAIPRNVLVRGSELAVSDATWSLTHVVSAGDALVHGLRTFATHLLASGGAHPWRIGVTPDELTVTLAAMAGYSVSPADIARVSTTWFGVRAAINGSSEYDQELLNRDLERGRHARDLPAADEVGYRELLTQYRALAREMREKDGQIVWLEGTLRLRDRYIRRLEKTIERYEDTLTYRTVEAFRAPRRIATNRAVGLAKSTADEVLPPGALSRARGLATRLLK